MSLAFARPFATLGYGGLLASLVVMLLLAPMVEPQGAFRVATSLAFAALLVFSVWTVSHDTRATVIASTLATFVFIGSTLIDWVDTGAALGIATLGVACVFFAYVSSIVLRDVFTSRSVTANTIVGAICAYILLGMLWGYLYSLVEAIQPGSFSTDVQDTGLVGRFVYFSMVTLTTLGYGDITPVSAAARGLAVVEATLGQVYLTVLVARLVGIHLTQNRRQEHE
ncbi:MAG: ion channel [Pseudomonadota bacterium]